MTIEQVGGRPWRRLAKGLFARMTQDEAGKIRGIHGGFVRERRSARITTENIRAREYGKLASD
jgi:hypothetical protein